MPQGEAQLSLCARSLWRPALFHTSWDLCVFVLPLTPRGQVPLSHTPKGTPTSLTHVALSTESGSLWTLLRVE